MGTDFSTHRTNEIIGNLKSIKLLKPYDVMITGVTGAGKSTTINALLNQAQAKVGVGVDPETKEVKDYELGHFIRFWDTPGLGDGVEQDKENITRINELINRDYLPNGDEYKRTSYTHYPYSQHLIKQGFGSLTKHLDFVLVIVEGSNKDMGMTYKLLNEVLLPKIQADRILVAINQADVAMKGRGWNSQDNCPNDELLSFLEEQSTSIQRRIKETSNLNIPRPLYYSAEYGYNVDKLLDSIIDNMQSVEEAVNKRFAEIFN